MSDNNLAIKYSDESYLTRSELSNALGTSLIDPIWNSILAYRNQFRRQLNLHDVSKIRFSVCYVPKIVERINSLEKKFSEYIVDFGGLGQSSLSKQTLFREMTINELRSIAKANKINVNDVALHNIVEYKNVDSIYEVLVRYFSALVHLEKNPTNTFSSETIEEYYRIISGEENLDSIYRKNEINSQSQRFLINREYAGAPVHEIAGQMNNLINFVNTSKDSFVVKVAIINYMINYVKPFEKYNKEMASILSKIIIASNDVDEAAIYIPLESISADEKGDFAGVAREIQRSRDLTYELTRVMDYIEEAMQTVVDRIVQLTVDGVKNSFYVGEDREEFKEEFGFEAPENIIETKPESPVEQEHKEVEEVVPAIPQRVIVKEERTVEFDNEEELSDKQLKKLANKLLEENPFLKKGQAHFYVRHCSKGKYYTIQQYKKCEGCVYETARTSMDNLAKQGYYRRESIKNKFVYTPIDKE